MKVIALTLATLCLATVTKANWDYKLQCTREEVGIRWPSYFSNSDYYVCQREGGKQLRNSCPPGEVFTFVLQSCTSPNRFIPPPPMNVLPTSAPVAQPQPHNPQPNVEQPQTHFPKPIHPPQGEGPLRPPVIIHEPPTIWENPAPVPPVIIDEPQLPERPHVQLPEEEIPEPTNKPGIPSLPGKPKPHIPSLPLKPSINSEAPMPPTPAPTPPVVVNAQPPKRQPPSPPGKRQPPKLPGQAKKQPPKPTGKKQPPKPEGKKPPTKPIEKKEAPKPTGKKQIPSLPGKA